MKFHTYKLVYALLIVLLTSCSTAPRDVYYQIYTVEPISTMSKSDTYLIYEDANCNILYNFWSNGGDLGLEILNKTDSTIYLNLEDSYYVINGFANDYYQDRVYSYSSNLGVSASKETSSSKYLDNTKDIDKYGANVITANSQNDIFTSKGYTVSYNEQRIVRIPAKSTKNIEGATLVQNLYRDCDLYRFPDERDQIKPKSFILAESPINFDIILNYKVGISGQNTSIINKFYISKIINYPSYMAKRKEKVVYCGESFGSYKLVFNDYAPNQFYFEYYWNYYYSKH